MINPELDGVDHINVYSKGKTKLGRFLTNFAYSPIETEDGKFNSIEGYWYWLGCNDDRLRKASGFAAKKLGREIGAPDWQDGDIFKSKILAAITIKVTESPLFKELCECKLPLKHYYTYGTKVVEPEDGKWILDHLESFKTNE